jgi:hypothetical protein
MIDQKHQQNVEYFNCIGSMMTNDARCTREIKSRIAMANQLSTTRRFISPANWIINLRKKPVKCYICGITVRGAATWTLREVEQKYVERFEMWCWRRMEKISWIDRVRNEECYIESRSRGISYIQ